MVDDAGLILAATPAEGLLLRELFDEGVDPGDAPGGANVGEKAMTLVHPALAGATWIGDADWLRAGATGEVLGHPGGCILHAGHVLALVHLGFGPSARPGRRRSAHPSVGGRGGPGPLTIDIDSTHCQTYGLAKQGAAAIGRDGTRGYHPLVASVAGTADVLHSRLREAWLT